MSTAESTPTPTGNPHDDTHRHQCEVRWLIRKYRAEGREGVERYLRLVAEKRKHDPGAAERLRVDAREQLRLGNEGGDGDWR